MLIEGFEKSVKEFASRIAIKTHKETITYLELNRFSNRIANRLHEISQSQNISPLRIGLLMDSAVDMIAGILGVLKSAHIYIPLTSDYPAKRLSYILQHADIKCVLTDKSLVSLLEEATVENPIPHILIEDIKENTSSGDLQFTRSTLTNEDAYILYTSGSTGVPKGVRQTHRNIHYFISRYIQTLQLNYNDKLTLFSSFVHDAAVMDIYSALTVGAALYPLQLKTEGVFSDLTSWLKEEQITIWHSVPTVFRYFMAEVHQPLELPLLRYIVFGGEAVLRNDFEKFATFFPSSCRVFTLYGQTESSFNSGSFFSVSDPTNPKEITLTIGDPVEGTQLFVMDDQGAEAGDLEVGEIIVLNDHITPGYWKDEKTTAEKFVDDPENGRIYYTGDLGRRLRNGKIEYTGRKDNQIKLRGFRIELGEIENLVMQYDRITQAAVTVVDGISGDKFLACYFSGKKDYDIRRMRDYLVEHLPGYMVPVYLKQLDRLPTTVTGKIDKNALPFPEIISASEYVPPRNELERKLVDMWAEILNIGKDVIGIDNSFFLLGGHSLSVTILTSRMHKELNVVIPLAEVFERKTIRGLTEYIAQVGENPFESIESAEEREYYPLSPIQRQLYIIQQFTPDSTAYNIPFIFFLIEAIPHKILEETFKKLIARHEILRTSFEMKGSEIIQRVHPTVEFSLEFIKVKPEEIAAVQEKFIVPFDLSKAPLFHACLLDVEGKYILMNEFHHIIADNNTLNGILEVDYLEMLEGKILDPVNVHYKDYCIWYFSEKMQSVVKRQGQYWKGMFEGELPVMEFPYDFPRSAKKTYEGKIEAQILDEETTVRLKNLGAYNGATLYMVLFSAFVTWLYRLTGQEDIIVGTPLSARKHASLDSAAGMFVNTLPLRTQITGDMPFEVILEDMKRNTLDAIENQEYPFEELVNHLSLKREVGQNPLFDIAFNVLDERNYKGDTSEKGGKDLFLNFVVSSRFDLSLTVIDRGRNLLFRFEYSTELFKEETIERITRYYRHILPAICDNPGIKIGDIPIMSTQEQEQLLFDFNRTQNPYSSEKTFIDLFSLQVESNPYHVAALDYQDGVPRYITYSELNRRSLEFHHLLKEKGVVPGSIIGIKLERSIDLLIGIIGILHAGSVYMPIDPQAPAERIQYMLKDSNAILFVESLTQLTENPLNLSQLNKSFSGVQGAVFQKSPMEDSHSLCYVIYTSGTTGKPKGVMVEHPALMNLCSWHNRTFSVVPRDHASQYASVAFDASLWEIFPYLSAGASLYIVPEEIKLDVSQLNRFFEKHDITIGFLPTQVCEQFQSQENRSLRALLTGGDKLQSVKSNLYTLYNNYGPTENTVVTTSCAVEGTDDRISIGKPIDNNNVLIIGKNSTHLQPVGVAGELIVTGNSLARGYLNNPELTFERFGAFQGLVLKNPPLDPDKTSDINKLLDESIHSQLTKSFKLAQVSEDHYVGATCRSPLNTITDTNTNTFYKTGDLARWLEDGNIEFLGRIDQQVKIRGNRIELGEIEVVLKNLDSVKDAVVLARGASGGDKNLWAYVVGKKSNNGKPSFELESLKRELMKVLPLYMIPAFFVPVDSIPLTNSGKIDKPALEKMSSKWIKSAVYAEPIRQVEKTIADAWKEILELEQIGIDDSFFDVGGNSLKVLLLSKKLSYVLEKEITAVNIFTYPTIRTLADYLEQGQKTEEVTIKEVDRGDLSNRMKKMRTNRPS